jgi:AmmeMemoRadiSam system protein B
LRHAVRQAVRHVVRHNDSLNLESIYQGSMIRPPAVAGQFYSSNPNELAQAVDAFLSPKVEKKRALGCVVPHAGYIYSGHVAGALYSALEIPARLILIGPRHFPRGESLAILSEGSWTTPLGEAKIDSALAAELKHEVPRVREDMVAHEKEHSLEVQIPFLQRIRGDFQFVPIVLGTDRYGVLEELGHAVGKVAAAQREPVLVVASSDMNHYESDAITRVKDERAIARVLALDPRGLYDTVRAEEITMCGIAAAVVMLVAVRDMGATNAELVRYATSGDINGDRDRVVGYAGIVIR